MAKGNRRFWIVSKEKAAAQIIGVIEQKKRVAYITSRWWLVALLMKLKCKFSARNISLRQ